MEHKQWLGTTLSCLKSSSYFLLTKQLYDMATTVIQFNGESTGPEVDLENVMTAIWDILKVSCWQAVQDAQ